MMVGAQPMTLMRVFARIQPEENERRWYAISRRPTLFDTWAVHPSWGCVDANQSQQRILELPTAKEAPVAALAQGEESLGSPLIWMPAGPFLMGSVGDTDPQARTRNKSNTTAFRIRASATSPWRPPGASTGMRN